MHDSAAPTRPLRAHRMLRGALAVVAVAVLAGCASPPADRGGTGTDYAQVRMQPAATRNGWLDDSYAHGFGGTWSPSSITGDICGIGGGIVLVDVDEGPAGAVVGERLDGGEAYRIENAGCTTDTTLEGMALVTVRDRERMRVERLDIATGERATLLEDDGFISVAETIAEIDGVVLATAWAGDTAHGALYALRPGAEPLWRNDGIAAVSRCALLDGGPGTASAEVRIGCERSMYGHALVDATSGETIVPYPDERIAEHVAWARDGLVVRPTGLETPMRVQGLDGGTLEPDRFAAGTPLPAPRGALVMLDDLVAAPHAAALTRDGRVVAYRAVGDELVLVASGARVEGPTHLHELFVTGDGAALVVAGDDAMRIVAPSGETIGTGPVLGWGATTMSGLLVDARSETPMIHLPARAPDAG